MFLTTTNSTTTNSTTTVTRRRQVVLGVALATLTLATAISEPLAQSHPAPPSAERRIERAEQAVMLGLLEQDVLDQLRVGGQTTAIVSFAADDNGQDRRRTKKLLRHVSAGGQPVRHFDTLNTSVVELKSEDALLAILRDPATELVAANRLFEAAYQQSLDLIRQPVVAAKGYAGAGVYVGVLDTGVNYAKYPSYFPAGSIAGTKEIAPNDNSPDDGGHGTHVSSTVLLVAPKAKLFVADVFHWQYAANGQLKNLASSESILAGVQWMIDLKQQGYNIRAVNLSLGGGHYTASCSDGYRFRQAHEAGIIPVVAAGNSAFRDNNDNPTSTYQRGIGHPGCSSYALSVGAVTDGSSGCTAAATADRVAVFSQSSEELDLLAPGACITAAGGTFQGTSMAAPHVAGAVAILAAAKPAAGANEIRTALFSTGSAITDTRSAITRNRLDVPAALNNLMGTSAGPIVGDTTPPVVKAPVAAITAGASVGQNGLVHTTFSWSASDASGIRAYAAKLSTNGGAWTDITLASATSTSVALLLTAGSKYRLTVAARDGAGNWSTWSSGAAFTVGRYGENHTAVTYSGRWEARSWTDALGGSLNVSGTAGAYGCFRFNARNVAWLGTMDSNRGVANVWLDGTKIATLDLYSATVRARTALLSWAVDPSVTHDLCVEVVGTIGRPTIDIDGFALLY